MTIKEALASARDQLALPFIERPRLEAEILLQELLKKERPWLHAHDETLLSDEESQNYQSLLKRRLQGEPIEYILERASFYSRDFYVASGVLIPRPETEILIDWASSLIGSHPIYRVAEVGIGSGIISSTLALLHPHLTFEASDISPRALEVAKENLKRMGVENRITLHLGSLLEPLKGEFDLLLSNPPYIAQSTPLPKPLSFEPSEALFGGERGSELLEELIKGAQKRSIPYMIAEMGYDQREAIERFMERIPHQELRFYQDLAGLDRGFIVRFDSSLDSLHP